jgi:predicted porin
MMNQALKMHFSRGALAAAASMIMSASVAGTGHAADLGGGCCADLEQRVAELEATTARKGNRVVSLQVYGQVNKALLYWDNGDDDDIYVVDNDYSTSRFGFKGSAKMRPGWTAGYNLEIDLFGDSNSDEITETNDEGAPSTGELRLRLNEVYIESEQLGRVTLGQGSSASDGTSEVVLANSLSNSALNMGLRISVMSGSQLTNLSSNLDGVGRVDRVRYDSPSIYGFMLSASWGEDDYYDLALRYKNEWNSIRVAAAISYVNGDECHGAAPTCTTGDLLEFDQVSGSLSVMHVPTGIYVALSAGERDYDAAAFVDPSFWYVQGGLERRFFPSGATTIYGEYGQFDDFKRSATSSADRLGFGIVQTIDSAAMDLYAQAQFWDFDQDGLTADEGELNMVMVGTRIKF